MGAELNLYSKVFKITNCDDFTRNFMRKLGVRMPDPSSIPSDPYSSYRKAVSTFIHGCHGYLANSIKKS